MPKNCSADVQAVIGHVDRVLAKNDPEVEPLKALFNLGGVKHNDDFAGFFTRPQWLWTWKEVRWLRRSSRFTSSYILQHITVPQYRYFEDFCDALEVKTATREIAPVTGFGLDHALPAWAAWSKAIDPDLGLCKLTACTHLKVHFSCPVSLLARSVGCGLPRHL